jgi:hypothetical protein
LFRASLAAELDYATLTLPLSGAFSLNIFVALREEIIVSVEESGPVTLVLRPGGDGFQLARMGGAKRNPSFLWIYVLDELRFAPPILQFGRGRGQRTYPNTVFELFFLLDQERAEIS